MDFDKQSRYCRPADGIWYTETEATHPVHGKVKTIRPFAPGQRWVGLEDSHGPFVLKQVMGSMWTAVDGGEGTAWVDMVTQAFDLLRPNSPKPYVFLGWDGQTPGTKSTQYPNKCPRCGSPAYVGAVPTALDCSNDKCPSKTKGGGIRK